MHVAKNSCRQIQKKTMLCIFIKKLNSRRRSHCSCRTGTVGSSLTNEFQFRGVIKNPPDSGQSLGCPFPCSAASSTLHREDLQVLQLANLSVCLGSNIRRFCVSIELKRWRYAGKDLGFSFLSLSSFKPQLLNWTVSVPADCTSLGFSGMPP